VQSRQLMSDGEYVRLSPGEGEPVIDSQSLLLKQAGSWHLDE